jgi:hypothetical protein
MHLGNRKYGKNYADERLQGSSRLDGIKSEQSLDTESGKYTNV